jgi:hypothetical protein
MWYTLGIPQLYEARKMATEQNQTSEVRVMVPAGALGSGIRKEHVQRGISAGAQAIALDAGSTDSGPSYLGRGISKFNREAVKRDLEVVLAAREQAGIPLLIGSCGTSGCDLAVDWTSDIVLEIAHQLGHKARVAILYSEQNHDVMKDKNAQNKIHSLPPSADLTDEIIESCEHIVALMGVEPYIAALKQGADIILGGRTTDTAVLAAVPLMHGAGAGAAWHASKVAECGGVCTVNRGDGGVLMRVGESAFEIEPLSLQNQCDVQSISAHMLYENADPFRLIEPGGILNVVDARYTQLTDRVVSVAGSKFEPMPYTMKLEGAGKGAFQTISFIGIRDPMVLASLDEFHDGLHAGLTDRILKTFGTEAGDYDLSLRIYGWNGVSGEKMPTSAAAPHEVGVMLVITAATQDLATRMSKTCNPMFFHFPLRPNVPQPSYAFPFSPAEIERGQLFEFKLNHVVDVEHGLELVRTRWLDLGK